MLFRSTCAVAALTDQGLAGAFAERLVQADENLRPTLESLLKDKKKSRAETKKPAVPET